MNKYNPKNERIKRDYFRFQTQAKQKSDATVNGIRKAIDRFEIYNSHKDFNTFNKDQAIAFKKHIVIQKTVMTYEPLSKSTVLSTVTALKDFFQWLAWQPGYKSKIHVPDIEYLNLSDKDISIAKSIKYKNFPTLEQIRKVIFSMPSETVIQRRDRALIAFTILTGMRDSAIASLRLKHITNSDNIILVLQNPDEVNTKNSKQIFTYFYPIDDDIKNIAINWIKELRESLLFGENDPLFPRTKLSQDENNVFKPDGVEAIQWQTANPIREVFKRSFIENGLPYFSPHRFRNTLTHIGQQICKTPEEFKAWSQNLGHSDPSTTFASYGQLDPHRQGEVLKNVRVKNDVQLDEQEVLKKIRALIQ